MFAIQFEKEAWQELGWWIKNHPKIALKIVELIEAVTKTPFEGIGKPEPLRNNWKGYWSRRITDEHRLVYKVENRLITIFAVKGHY